MLNLKKAKKALKIAISIIGFIFIAILIVLEISRAQIIECIIGFKPVDNEIVYFKPALFGIDAELKISSEKVDVAKLEIENAAICIKNDNPKDYYSKCIGFVSDKYYYLSNLDLELYSYIYQSSGFPYTDILLVENGSLYLSCRY